MDECPFKKRGWWWGLDITLKNKTEPQKDVFFCWSFFSWVMYWEKRHAPYCISCVQVGEVVVLWIIYLDCLMRGKSLNAAGKSRVLPGSFPRYTGGKTMGQRGLLFEGLAVTLLKIEHIPPMDDGKSFPSNLTGISLVPLEGISLLSYIIF